MVEPVSMGAIGTALLTGAAGAAAGFGLNKLTEGGDSGGQVGQSPLEVTLPNKPLPTQSPAGSPKGRGQGSMYQSFLAGAASSPQPTRGAGKTLLGQ